MLRDDHIQEEADRHHGPGGATRAFAQSLHLLGTRRFGTFCFASLLSNFGTWAQNVAEPWLLLTLGASSFLIGLDSFVMSAPVWVLTLVGGLLADRSDRRRVIATCQSIQMLCPLLLVVLLLTGGVQPWIVIALALVVGVTDALSMPSFTSIVPSIVERKEIPAALALNATQFNLSRVLGPALAGVIMAGVGAVGCFALSWASYLPFIWVALWILPRGKPAATEEDGPENRRIRAGLRYVMRTPNLRYALLTVLFTSILCGPLIVFCPVLVKQAFQGDVGGFSAAVSAFGIGGLLGAVALLGVDPAHDRRRMSSWLAVAYGATVALVAVNPWFWGLPVLLALAGLFMTVSNTSANALLQSTSLSAMRGRTVSLYMLAMRGGIAIGSLATGLAVDWLGVRDALLIDGAAAIVLQLLVGIAWSRTPAPLPANPQA
jgi:MFS family permease